jgi:hypothetical protein
MPQLPGWFPDSQDHVSLRGKPGGQISSTVSRSTEELVAYIIRTASPLR